MDASKNIQRLAEVEYCLEHYFSAQFIPIMEKEKSKLRIAQVKEIKEYSTSFHGMLRTMANDMHGLPDDTVRYLQMTGKECSKTAEDYVGACKERLLGNDGYVSDLNLLAGEWRHAVVEEIGRERYDELSSQLGADLALAYVDYRIEQMMINRMVSQQMPKNSFEYILHKGAAGSLFGLSQEVLKSPLQVEIDTRGEAAYNPSATEKNLARGVSIATDAIATGGVCSWGGLARLVGAEVVFSGLESYLDKKGQDNGLTVEQCISQAVFGAEENIFPTIRQQSNGIKTYENDYIQSVSQKLSHPIPILTEKPFWETEWPNLHTGLFEPQSFMSSVEKEHRTADVPLVIAPGYEEEYLAMNTEQREQKEGDQAFQTVSEETGGQRSEISEKEVNENQTNPINSDGWSNLLQSVGLGGIGDIGRNLPYVIAMLPDMFVGLLTGKTTSINLKDDMIPVASILLGMFVKNPLLKLVLIGLGGANLVNKVGHEALERQNGVRSQTVRYKQYADEELNPRITNPVFRGNLLVATIDNIPCSVTIPAHVSEAYSAGVLPLNTLANAILAKHDRMKQLAEESYRNVEFETEHHRERGVALR